MAFVSLVVRGGAYITATQLLINTDYIVQIEKLKGEWVDGARIYLDQSSGLGLLPLEVAGTQVDHLMGLLMPE